MLDDELAAPGEEIAERLLAGRTVEDIGLVDFHPGQAAPAFAELVAQPGELLLFHQKLLARLEPCVLRYDLVLGHRPSPVVARSLISSWSCAGGAPAVFLAAPRCPRWPCPRRRTAPASICCSG